jgi:peptide-methionine (R)-S-oxide reductase
MMVKFSVFSLVALATLAFTCSSKSPVQTTMNSSKNPYYSKTDTTKLVLPDSVWKQVLGPDVYEVARHAATERPFTGEYWNYEGIGNYYCKACGNHLFQSDAKFASSCGWPSFFETIRKNSVIYKEDRTHGMIRTEVLCGRCDSHLGHVFDDGPEPTGLRFCMNSIVLEFEPLP